MRDVQFKDKAKFRRCLELFDVATLDVHTCKLEEPGLDATGLDAKPLLLYTTTAIAKEAMKKLLELENKPKAGIQTRGILGWVKELELS